MTAYERRIDENFRAQDFERVTIADGRLRTVTGEAARASGRYWRHVGHGIHGARAGIDDGVSDHVVGFGKLREGYYDSAGTDDAGFFFGNLSDGFAQILLMIEGDVGDDAEARIDHVGCIQTSPHADFEDDDVGTAAGEIFEAHGSQHLEKAGMPGQIAFRNQALGSAVDYVVEQSEIFVGDGGAVEANALVDADQMRRSVEASLKAGGLQDGCQRSSGGTLAVGAG